MSGDTTDDLTANIFPEGDYVPEVPAKREFLRWHQPRKQVVRAYQWAREIQILLDGRHPNEPLRYLGLPGADLLDIRYFQGRFCNDDRSLLFLGFNSGMSNDDRLSLNSVLDEMRRLDNVDSRSDVIIDEFNRIGRTNSLAWRTTMKMGPFDVINLDLCGSIASELPEKDGTLYTAIAELFGLQKARSEPWLLLVTMRVGRSHVNGAAANLLLGMLHENERSCAAFATECLEWIYDDTYDGDTDVCSESCYCRLISVGICKWLLKLSHECNAHFKVTDAKGYHVRPEVDHLDLVSLAIRISPVNSRPLDTSGLAAEAPAHEFDECAESIPIPRKVADMTDVDDLLESSPEIMVEMIEESAELLVAAGYDGDAYRSWATTANT